MGECVLVSLASQCFVDGALWVLLRFALEWSGPVGYRLSGGVAGFWGDWPYSSTSMAIKARPPGRAAH